MVKPLTKPNIIKKRTKPFKRHQTDRKICVKVTSYLQSFVSQPRCVTSLVSYSVQCRNHGDALRVLILESEESSKDVVLLCQTSVMAQTRRQGICCRMVCIAQTAQSILASTSADLYLSDPCCQISIACRLLQICGVQCQGTRAVDDAQQVSLKFVLAICLNTSK